MSHRLPPELQGWVKRVKADAWDIGFAAGAEFGRVSERYEPQWDPDPPPALPENPYRDAKEGGAALDK